MKNVLLAAAALGMLALALTGSRRDEANLVAEGRHTFRFDTFGDEDFWGGTLRLHEAIEGSKFGGVGGGVSPATALAVGLKVDVDALPESVLQALRNRQVDLNDPAVTLALLQANAVVGVTGFFNASGSLRTMGIQCALCHSTVDNSFAPGIGHRRDGFANRDLNVGMIVSLAPNLQPVADLLKTNVATVKTVLTSWGPGKFDAELLMDGKAFRPDGKPAATLIPPAYGLAGVNLHTWTGWGSVPYWNAFVANLEMHGKGNFFDPRLNDAAKFPVAAAAGFGNLPHLPPDQDRVTKKLAGLHLYQLSLAAPPPLEHTFNEDAARRGQQLFDGKAACNNCHVRPLFMEPGWSMHAGADVCVDDFQAKRSPDGMYRTAPLAGLSGHSRFALVDPQNGGGYYHDGRFRTLTEVVTHYNSCGKGLGLSAQEVGDLVEYLKSL